jgi:hypothetical protein
MARKYETLRARDKRFRKPSIHSQSRNGMAKPDGVLKPLHINQLWLEQSAAAGTGSRQIGLAKGATQFGRVNL